MMNRLIILLFITFANSCYSQTDSTNINRFKVIYNYLEHSVKSDTNLTYLFSEDGKNILDEGITVSKELVKFVTLKVLILDDTCINLDSLDNEITKFRFNKKNNLEIVPKLSELSSNDSKLILYFHQPYKNVIQCELLYDHFNDKNYYDVATFKNFYAFLFVFDGDDIKCVYRQLGTYN